MAKGKIESVGDFELLIAIITTSSGLEVDISSSIINLTLYEDTTMTSVSGEIMLQDAFALTNIGPIIGQEYLKLKIRTPSLTEEESTIDFTENVFLINSIQNRAAVGNNVQVYILNFTTSELVKNQRTKISRSLRGSYSDIVKKILTEDLDCKKDIYIEPTSGNKKIVAPNMRPFDVIKMASKESTSKLISYPTVPNYIFYETLKGYHFRSLGSLYAQNSVQDYTSFVKGSNIQAGGYIDIERELANVLDFEIVQGSNSLVNYTTGVYASDLIVHNIFNKSIQKYSYGIFENFKKEYHINRFHGKGNQDDFPIHSHLVVEDNGKTAQDFRSRIFLTPISQNGFSDAQHNTANNTSPFTPTDPHKWLQPRTSQLVQLEQGLLVNILTHGNTVVSAGDIVKLNLPYNAAFKTVENEQNDRFFKGAFLVKRLRHDFDFADKKHKTHLTLVKDSLEESLDGPDDNFEPKPKSSAKIIDTLEELYPRL
tara:strand:+ start:132 stop:1580 length:1449 start_codon:yes stop_codon:yes gene_type:complete